METQSEQLPAERRPDPRRWAEGGFFDDFQDSDTPRFSNHEGQQNLEALD